MCTLPLNLSFVFAPQESLTHSTLRYPGSLPHFQCSASPLPVLRPLWHSSAVPPSLWSSPPCTFGVSYLRVARPRATQVSSTGPSGGPTCRLPVPRPHGPTYYKKCGSRRPSLWGGTSVPTPGTILVQFPYDFFFLSFEDTTRRLSSPVPTNCETNSKW